MRPTATRHATHNFQAPANWDAAKDGVCSDLPVRVQMSGGTGIFETVSTWKPNAEDLAHLNRGGVVELFICLPPVKVFGESVPNQPVVGMCVVDPVDAVIVDDRPGTSAITINEHAHGDDSHGC